MTRLDDAIGAIVPAGNEDLQTEIQAHLDDLTKPQGSLGRLEEFAMRYCLATGTPKPSLGKKRIYCFAGDHGVAAEGVSAFPSEVTPQMVGNMLAGGAAINSLSRHVGAELIVVDMGVADPLDDMPGLCRKKVRNGTANMAKGPAMTIDEARQAVETGIELAETAYNDGVRLIGTGDMGIANTTPSAALIATFLSCDVEDVTGRGTGIDDAVLAHKVEVIRRAIETNKDMLTDPLSTMAALGGLEIAGICGLIVGAASLRMPVVVDGFISSAAALTATSMNEHVRDYMFFSHLSHEAGHSVFVDKFGVAPVLDLKMRLGEGTGAALAMSIIEASLKICNEMATFSSAGVSDKD